MLLKGLEEVQVAPSPIQAAEMVLVRLAYVADLPAPAELVRSIAGSAGAVPSRGNGATTGSSPPAPLSTTLPAQPTEALSSGPRAANALRVAAEFPQSRNDPALDPVPHSFAEVVALFDRRREALLRSHLCSHVHLVHFEPGRIEFRPAAGAPRDLANRLGELLREWTGKRWMISVSEAAGAPTLHQQEEGRDRDLRNEVASHPLVQAVLETFPGATITAVRERFTAAEPEADELSPDTLGDEPGIAEEEGA